MATYNKGTTFTIKHFTGGVTSVNTILYTVPASTYAELVFWKNGGGGSLTPHTPDGRQIANVTTGWDITTSAINYNTSYAGTGTFPLKIFVPAGGWVQVTVTGTSSYEFSAIEWAVL